MNLGSSGARIVIDDDRVSKFDTERTGTRVRAQGIWLDNQCGVESLPSVTEIYANGYVMELLEQLPLTELLTYRAQYCERLLSALGQIWPQQRGRVRFDPLAHNRYVNKLLGDVGLSSYRKTLRRYARSIPWFNLIEARTHGDGILENLLVRRRNGFTTYVLIDPIPACPAVPDLQAVDVGRVIQSAIGYERIRYAVPECDLWDLPVRWVLNQWHGMTQTPFNISEVRAACYFAVIHLLRGIRTAPDDVIGTKLESLLEDLMREVDQWMR